MKNLIKKLAAAKLGISGTKTEKKGFNNYSNYKYFLPEQIEQLVHDECVRNGLFTKFDLKRNELGVFGVLTVFDVDTAISIEFEAASAIPTITATNATQQLGGAMTYTERYLKMTAFGIIDNSLDFDTSENTKKQIKEGEPARSNEEIMKIVNDSQDVQSLTILYQSLTLEQQKELKNDFSKKKNELNKK